MHTSIFSFIQPQVNSQPQQLLPGILPQENAGTAPGIFDALITEYTLTKNSDIQQTISAQNNSDESSQPVNFSDSAKFSGIITEISQPRNETPESNPNITENNNAWRNLFADVKRNPEIMPKSHENFLPQNDFDDGITIADSKIIDTVNIVDADFDSHAEIHNDDFSVKDNADDIPEIQQEAQTGKKSSDYSRNDAENLDPSAEKTEPEITQDIAPETVRQNQNIPEHEGREISSPSAQNVKPEITEPSRNENVTESQPSSESETPAEIPEPQNIPRKSPRVPERTESRENPGMIQNGKTPEKSPAKSQDIHAEIDSPSETETPEIESPYQASNPQSESESPEIKEPLKRESPEISRENKSPEEQHEISDTNIIMAGLQAVPPAQNSPEISQTPETDSTPKNLRTPGNSPRKSQTVTRETENAISFADSENPADDSRIVTPAQSRTTQNQSGHEGTSDSESTRPSESHGIAETPRVRITNQPERDSRTTQRTESRNDTRRTEALNDFQTFFDSVNRVRRSPARVSAQPLSLRTGTYDSDGIQSRPTALRNSIVNTVRFIRSDGVRKANIIVDPPALGRISVELTSSSSGVEASVKVVNEQIRQIVQDQFTQLRDNLLQQGVQVSEFTVDVQQDKGNGSGSQNQREDYTFTPSDDDDDTEIFRADLEEGLLYWIA